MINLSPTTVEIQGLETLVLFGSNARGDSELGSDVDIAAFGESATMNELISLKRRVTKQVGEHVSLSVYSKRTAELMAESGSLFLWHLRLEGKVIAQASDWFAVLLGRLAPYSRQKAYLDLQTFSTVLEDTDRSLHETDSTLLFEAANLFAVLRSVGMIASMLNNQPCFSRLGTIRYLQTLLGNAFELSDREVNMLKAARLFYSAKATEKPDLDRYRCLAASAKVARIINMLKEAVCR